jgi:hypothetical protein
MAVLGFELRDSHSITFCVFFEIGSRFMLGQAWMAILLFMISCIAGMTGMNHCPQLSLLRQGLENYLPNLGK